MIAGPLVTAGIFPALADDLPDVQRIYAHYVLTSSATFEEAVPTMAEMEARWNAVIARNLPFLIAKRGSEVVGFAYAAPFRQRSGYRYTVEDSVYVRADAVGEGHGRRLLAAVIEDCAVRGYRQMIAVIGDGANVASRRLHSALGFRHVGVLTATGLKFGRWLDSVYMQRALGEGDRSIPAE